MAKNPELKLIDEIYKSLNSEQTLAYGLAGTEWNPSDITDWIPSSNPILDLIITNGQPGLIPAGRIVEISGLESCVTEDTLIDVELDQLDSFKTITIGEVEELLKSGKTIRVKSKNNEYVKIKSFIDKGNLRTLQTTLKNGYTIKTSEAHLFFTNIGWQMASSIEKSLEKNSPLSILCDDGEFHEAISCNYVGHYRIVDISVYHPDECYFGNGMLNHNTGKSLLVGHLIVETQKKDGIAVLIDTEQALSKEFMQAIGIDLSKLIYISTSLIEEVFESIEKVIEIVRKKSPDKLVGIFVDSVMGATNKVEDDSTYDKDGYATQKAIIISKAMRKINQILGRQRIALVFTNQLRTKLNCVNPYTTNVVWRKEIIK